MRQLRPAHPPAVIVAAVVALAIVATPPAAAYRPFDSTDAAVADPWVVDAEIGSFNLARDGGQTRFANPQVVLNVGLVSNWEVIGEVEVQESVDGNTALADPGIFVKTVLKDGVLQGRSGPSIATEMGVLLPSTVPNEGDPGFAALAIISTAAGPLLFHLNGGGGVSRTNASGYAIWGVIAELPVAADLRVAGEINGGNVETEDTDASALLGAIWDVPGQPLALDAGVRCGLTDAADDWAITTGFTYAFSLRGAAVSGGLE